MRIYNTFAFILSFLAISLSHNEWMNELGKNLNLAEMEPIGTGSLPILSSFLFQVSVPSTATIPIAWVPCGILPLYPDSTGRYDIAPSSAQAGTSWNQLSFYWSIKIIDRNGTGEPSGPSVGYPHEHLGAQASPTRSNRYPFLVPPSSNWSQQVPSVLCQHEHRGVQASLKLQTFELEILASPSRMRTKISTLGTFLNIQLLFYPIISYLNSFIFTIHLSFTLLFWSLFWISCFLFLTSTSSHNLLNTWGWFLG